LSEKYRTAVETVERCGADIALMRLRKPDGYDSQAGQWFRLTLDTVEGTATRTFTNAAAPDDEWLEVITRLSGSAFKNRLGQMRTGDEVEIVGPGGRLTLPADEKRVAYLVGGVGIAPARSMLRDAMHRRHVFDDALVLYGNRDAKCVPFQDELLAMDSAGVRVVPVLERPHPGWTGETGLVTASIVARHCDLADGRPLYVAGPPPMVAAVQRVLDELGIDESRRRIEWFGTPVRHDSG